MGTRSPSLSCVAGSGGGPSASPVAVSASDAPTAVAGGRTILVVEDEPALRKLASMILQAQGYQVLEAASPRRALALDAQGMHVDLLLTDLVMPSMRGTELASTLVTRHPDLRVIYMSACVENPFGLGTEVPPDVNWLPKPFAPDALERMVQDVLARPEAA